MTTISGERLPQALHSEAIVWLLSQLDDSERTQFKSGLKACARRIHDAAAAIEDGDDVSPMEAAMTSWIDFIDSWFASVQMSRDEGWRKRVTEAQRMLLAGEGDVVTVEQLRSRVAG